jgi:hypothetical protein
MNAMNHHEAWEMKPRKLSIEEVEQPERVIAEFFQVSQLPQVRWYMWDMMKTLVAGNFPHLDTSERNRLLCFYEQLERLIEGAHVLYDKSSVKA